MPGLAGSWWDWAARPPPTAGWGRCARCTRSTAWPAWRSWPCATCGRASWTPAEVYAPQKGATAAQVELLRRRLERLADVYLADHGVDVRALAGAGAAGGLAGGLAVAGAALHPGFDVVADEVGLYDLVVGADLVITAEGFLDEQSFEGKVVGGVVELAAESGIPCVAIVGEVVDHPGAGARGRRRGAPGRALRRGPRPHRDTVACIEAVAGELFATAGTLPPLPPSKEPER
jgi:hypothetical protein